MEKQKKLWFRRKRYGWGWYPVSWEGWVVLLLYVVGMVHFVLLSNRQHSVSDALFAFAVPFVILNIVLIMICYQKGERPKWQWGEKDG
ncbi:MAG TPA: hypothetical protein VL576_00900 [Candidatus Paceibacterota bacterium]|jgi:hypothetical protein|nr:hypothetical protein [Candidatus Paceibacterota bacterium]